MYAPHMQIISTNIRKNIVDYKSQYLILWNSAILTGKERDYLNWNDLSGDG